MSRTITAWAVVNEHTGETLYIRNRLDEATHLARPDHLTVVELTGELPDPPKTVTVDNRTWTARGNDWTSGAHIHTAFYDAARFLDRIWELENGGAS